MPHTVTQYYFMPAMTPMILLIRFHESCQLKILSAFETSMLEEIIARIIFVLEMD